MSSALTVRERLTFSLIMDALTALRGEVIDIIAIPSNSTPRSNHSSATAARAASMVPVTPPDRGKGIGTSR
jgi:hypothetical protein